VANTSKSSSKQQQQCARAILMMRAAVFRQFGPPTVLQEEKDFPRPQRRKTEVLIQVCFAVLTLLLSWLLDSGWHTKPCSGLHMPGQQHQRMV
jgi:hypothetical protein